MRKFIDYVVIALKGVAMGIADVIPGVSGGTIAFISGIYEELLDSLKAITPKNILLIFSKNGFKQFVEATNLKFLLAVLIGIAVSFLSLAKLMVYLLNHYPVHIWSFFFGLILASVWYVGKTVQKWNLASVLSLVVGIAAGVFITIVTPTQTPNALWFIFLTGAIAIIAMIMPGISGSFVLLLLGKYAYMMGAIVDFKVLILLVFISGALIGLVSFSHLLSWLLNRFNSVTVALLTGLMAGSLVKIWPWKVAVSTYINSSGDVKPLVESNVLPETYKLTNGLEPHMLQAILFFGLGVILIIIFESIAIKNKKEPPSSEFDRKKLGF